MHKHFRKYIRFVYIGLIFFIILLSHACNSNLKNKPDKEAGIKPFKDSISYKIFSTENNGFGFDIMVNGKDYIHQPIIPCIQGLHFFSRYEDAALLAKFIVNKLKSKTFKFLLQKFELDSLIKDVGEVEERGISGATSYIDTKKSKGLFTPDSAKKISTNFPALSDAPFKSKWTVKEIVPFGYRGGGFCFSIGKYTFIGSGEYRDEIIKDFWCYNSNSETWTCLAEIPAKCFSGISFSILNKGYAGLGTEIGTSSGKFNKHMFEYDPVVNKWGKISDFPGTPRIDASVFVINHKAYAGTGYDGANTKDFYEYNPETDSWKRVADFAGGDLHASIGIGTGKQGFVVAGARAPYDFKFVYEYIPVANKWERKKDIPGYERNFLSGNYIDTNFIIAGDGGSYEADRRLRDFYVYNIKTNRWSRLPDYPVSSKGSTRACGANVKGRIFFGTGFGGDFLNDWNVFEYYFSLRKDSGLYNETVCYPLEYDGNWQLYQECLNGDCYAGAQVKSAEELGNFSYSSRLTSDYEELSLKDNKMTTKFVLLPRYFAISTDKKPTNEVAIRLFFKHKELEDLGEYFEKLTGKKFSIDKIKILQYKGESNLHPQKNSTDINNYKVIAPQLFSYGFEGETSVASFSTATLRSEFYLAAILN